MVFRTLTTTVPSLLALISLGLTVAANIENLVGADVTAGFTFSAIEGWMFACGAATFLLFWLIPGFIHQGTWTNVRLHSQRMNEFWAERFAPLPRWAQAVGKTSWLLGFGIAWLAFLLIPPHVHAHQHYGPGNLVVPASAAESHREDEAGFIFLSGWMIMTCTVPALRLFFPAKSSMLKAE